ncbi:hypothetical protein [Lacrimispora sp. JR3]|uniref:hypothetical protein n=1 Tax=Lacrimispora sinapis TaxID=3111456 RepID=UPI0037478474
MLNIILGCLGILLTGIGYFLKELEKKRHFDRTNTAGIEGFKSYFDLKIQKFIDSLIRDFGILLMLLGITFLFYGVIFTFYVNE